MRNAARIGLHCALFYRAAEIAAGRIGEGSLSCGADRLCKLRLPSIMAAARNR